MKTHSKHLSIILLSLAVTACSFLQDTQSSLISNAFDKYLGKSAAEAKIFENALVEHRMEDMLGDRYQHTVDMLNTAKTIEKEGPMFYAISEANDKLNEQAGFAYNSDTNQMSVVTVKDNVSQLAYEKVNKGAEKITPPLPKAFESLMNPKKALNNAANEAKDKLQNKANAAVSNATGMNTGELKALKEQANPDAIKAQAKEKAQIKTDQAIDKALDKTIPSSNP